MKGKHSIQLRSSNAEKIRFWPASNRSSDGIRHLKGNNIQLHKKYSSMGASEFVKLEALKEENRRLKNMKGKRTGRSRR